MSEDYWEAIFMHPLKQMIQVRVAHPGRRNLHRRQWPHNGNTDTCFFWTVVLSLKLQQHWQFAKFFPRTAILKFTWLFIDFSGYHIVLNGFLSKTPKENITYKTSALYLDWVWTAVENQPIYPLHCTSRSLVWWCHLIGFLVSEVLKLLKVDVSHLDADLIGLGRGYLNLFHH